jgi:hypothetical protein
LSRRNSVRRHLSFANVASALALFLAVGGGTTAIALRGKATVDSGDIKNRAVKTRDLANNAATGAKVNESTLSIVPNASQLDGISSEDFQFGNGITASVAGGVDDGPAIGTVDLGGATLRIDCESDEAILTVRDDPGGVTPSAAAPHDVWIFGAHEAITTDQGTSTPVNIDLTLPELTVPVQIWSADNVVTEAQFNVFFDATPDLCVVAMPLSQTIPSGGAVAAAASADRLPPPRTSGFVPVR